VVAGLGVGILLVLGLWIPLQLSDSPMLAPLGKMAFDASLPASGAVFFVSLSMIAVQAWRLRQWHAGRGPFCHRCSGMVEEEIHRHRRAIAAFRAISGAMCKSDTARSFPKMTEEWE
jgi:hypothetical protein